MADDATPQAPEQQTSNHQGGVGTDAPTASPPRIPAPGAHWGPFVILEKLGEGGMGVVFKARDTRLDRIVALKLVSITHQGDPEAAKRLVREARAAARLDHPNICTIYSIEEINECRCITMQFVEGQTLTRLIADGPLSIEKFLGITLQIVAGLREAHRRGIAHRDIKSSNIMLTAPGQVKILDFGLARLDGRTTDSQKLTATGTTLGTLAYMAPEQLLGSAGDARSDLFSLGVVMYELLTGRLVFNRDTPGAIIQAILNEEPEDLRSVRADVPPEIAAVVAKALQKDRAKRYQSANEIFSELEPLHRQYLPSQAIASTMPARLRRPGLWGGALAAVLICAAIAGAAIWSRHRAGTGAASNSGSRAAIQSPHAANTGTGSATAGSSVVKPSIAVLPFSNLNKDAAYAHLEGGIADALEESLGGSGQFRMVERAQLDKTVAELNLNRSEYVDPATAQRVGRLIGAQYLAIGSFQVWQGEVRLNARLIRVETGEIVAADKIVGPAVDALRLPDQLAAKFLRALPPEVAGDKP